MKTVKESGEALGDERRNCLDTVVSVVLTTSLSALLINSLVDSVST